MSSAFISADGTPVVDHFTSTDGIAYPEAATERGVVTLKELEQQARDILNSQALGLVCSVDWQKAIPELCRVRFDGLPLQEVRCMYPALFVIRTTLVAARRSAAGHDNGLWENVHTDLGLSNVPDGEMYSSALGDLAEKTDMAQKADLVTEVPTLTTAHHHVMLANLHAVVPQYAVKHLWSIVGQACGNPDPTAVSLAKMLACNGDAPHPLKFLGQAATEESKCKIYVLDVLETLLWAHTEGLLEVADKIEYRSIPDHLLEALFEQTSSIDARQNNAAPGYHCALGGSDGARTIVVRKGNRDIPLTPDVLDSLYTGPLLFSKRNHERIVLPTPEDLLGGLFVLLRDAEHSLSGNNGTHSPWSEKISAALEPYSLYSISKGSEPHIVTVSTGDKYIVATTSDRETAYSDDGVLPPGVSVDGKAVYAQNPRVNAPQARLWLLKKNSGLTVNLGDLLFNRVGGVDGATGVVDVPAFTATARRSNGDRSFPEGVLFPGISLKTPEHCGPVVGMPVKGAAHHNTQHPPMFVIWHGAEYPLIPKKPGHKHISIDIAGRTISVSLPVASWSLEDSDSALKMAVGVRPLHPYPDQGRLKYLNVHSAGWPARLVFCYTQGGRQTAWQCLDGAEFRLDPSCHVRDGLLQLKKAHRTGGPITNIRVSVEYWLSHLGPIGPGSCVRAELFAINAYRDCPIS